MTATIKPLPKPKKGCAICGKPVTEAFLPFCSKRCQTVDLSRWMTGAYAIPVEEDDKSPRPDEDPQD